MNEFVIAGFISMVALGLAKLPGAIHTLIVQHKGQREREAAFLKACSDESRP